MMTPVFREQLNRTYEDPQLVLFTGAVPSACGFAQQAMGSFTHGSSAQRAAWFRRGFESDRMEAGNTFQS